MTCACICDIVYIIFKKHSSNSYSFVTKLGFLRNSILPAISGLVLYRMLNLRNVEQFNILKSFRMLTALRFWDILRLKDSYDYNSSTNHH